MLALFYGLRYSSHQRKLQKQTNSKKIQKNLKTAKLANKKSVERYLKTV